MSPERPRLEALLGQRILVLDGAMGTMLQQADLTADDFGGEAWEGCNEHLVLTRPYVVRRIHDAYFEAGADIVETNTFGATRLVLDEYALGDKTHLINQEAARIARASADAHTTADKPRYVAGSIGPTTRALTVTGGVTFDTLEAHYREQTLGLLQGGVDCLLVETCQDTLNVKAAALGIEQAFAAHGTRVPVLLSATIEPMGTMLAGQGIDAFYAAVEHLRPLTVGLNCATGPEFMTDHLRTLSGIATCATHVYPNAGLPDEHGHYQETPESLARKMARFVDEGLVNLVGGCCGTTPAHVTALARLVEGKRPRAPAPTAHRHVSGIEHLEILHENRPVLVGERTNVIGSRKFKRLVQEGKWEEGAEVGRAQVKNGAQVVDVCLADPDRDELEDARAFLPLLFKKVKAPLMIDSTDPDVIELALRMSQGKPIVNSINLEDGEERFERIAPLIRRYGAAVVVGCIDEDPQQGMAVTRKRKLEVARRSHELLTTKYGIPEQDIIFDPLVFPCGTGDENYEESAVETIEGVRLISERFPTCATILGISNVSFGLPMGGREVLNSVFLYHCVQAGLTYAIVNTEALERYPSIAEDDRRVAEDLLFRRVADPVAAFAEHFRGRKREERTSERATLPLDERLALNIVEGSKEGLFDDLDTALATRDGLGIINGPLMKGMAEVGRLFNDNQLIVAEVLQSAEAMKAAVDHLKPHMPKAEGTGAKGKVLLATVKGDVHDIGKNLVEIVLANNGYDVVNLGIKVPPDVLIAATREHNPDAIGLSGLLVKSAQQMIATAEDLREAGIRIPLFVGGAALTHRFTASRIEPAYGAPTFYAKDAMNGLAIANRWFSDERDALNRETRAAHDGLQRRDAAPARTADANARHEPARRIDALPRAPDFARHVLQDVDVRHLWPYVNPVMLFGKHLGLRGDVQKMLAEGDARARELWEFVEALKQEVARERLFHAGAVWRWYPANSEGESLILWDAEAPGEKVAERFTFPRQEKTTKRCISDWVRPVGDGIDSVALFALTAGPGVRELAERAKQEGAYLRSHAIQALALETAEGFAEYLHERIRDAWGIPDAPGTTMRQRFQADYTGLRVSFGYPACPDLADQEKLFALLRPADIGLELTDGFMMDPEASVSALVFHHPDARYFDAR